MTDRASSSINRETRALPSSTSRMVASLSAAATWVPTVAAAIMADPAGKLIACD